MNRPIQHISTFRFRRPLWYNIAMKHTCPICKKPTDSQKDAEFPFCSKRCRMLDLGAWSAEKYLLSDPIFDEQEIPGADRRALPESRRKSNETIH